MRIDILGTEYELIETTEQEDVRLDGHDGWCGIYDKEILIEKNIFPNCHESTIELSRSERSKYAKRHEIVHAYFNESGLDNYSANEQLVAWIAVQFPKMLKTFQAAGCI